MVGLRVLGPPGTRYLAWATGAILVKGGTWGPPAAEVSGREVAAVLLDYLGHKCSANKRYLTHSAPWTR